jgi:GNAT superfamily N-acetyltransferase
MGASLILTREEEPDPETVRVFGDGLSAYNAGFFPGADWSPHWLIGRNDAGAVSAGCRFVFEMDWVFVSWLWVAEAHRRDGEGTRLMRAVEGEARERGLRGAYLDTFSFQAPKFYAKLGYREFGRISDFPLGFDRIWLMKRFEGATPA